MVINMALTAFEVFGVLKLDTTQFNKSLNDAKDHVSGISRAAGVIGGGLATAAKTGAAAIGAATAAVVGFSKTAVDEATSFESAFTGVKKTVDASAEDYDKLSSWIMDASTRMASSKEEIAGTMEIAGQLGIRGVNGLEKFTETMIMLGDTTNLNAEEAAGALAKFGNIAGLKAEDMDRIGSTIVDLGNHFATTEADIVNMSTRLASAGTIAGLSATDILALSTAMSSVGINAEAGGTAMSQTLTSIAKMTELAGTAADEDGKLAKKLELLASTAGMTSDEFKQAWEKDAVGSLSKFITGLTNAEANGKSALVILDDLGMQGIRQSNMLQALSLANETLSGAIGMANTAFEENTALQHEAEMRYGTTESQMIQTKEAFKNLQVTVGKELMPTMSEFFSYSKTAIEDINKGLEQGGIEGMVGSIGTAISDALTQITEKLPQAIDLGIKLLSTLGQGLIENAPQIFNSLEKVADILLQHFWDAVLSLRDIDFKDFGDKLGQAISDFFDSQNSALAGFAYAASRLIEYIGNGLSEAIPQLVPYINDVIASIADFVTQEGPKLIDTGVNLATSLVTGLSETLPTLIPTAIDTLLTLIDDFLNGDGLDKIADAAVSLATNLATGIANAIPVIADKLPGILWKLLMGIVDNYPKFVEATAMIWTSFGKALLDLGSKLTEKGRELGDDLFGGFIEKIQAAFVDIKNAVTDSEIYQSFAELLGSIKELLSVAWGFLTQWWSILWTFVQTEVGIMKAGLTAAFTWVKTTVETWLNAIKLPFLIMFEAIKSAALLFWDLLKNAFTTSCNVISGVIKSFLALIKGDWKSALDNMKSAAQSGLDGVKNVFRSVIDTIKNLINNVIRTAKNWGKDLIDSFVTGIKAKISSVGDAIREVAEKIWDLMHFSEPEEGPLSDFHTYAPDMMKLFAKGVKDNTRLVTDQIQKSFDFSDVIAEQNVNVNQPVRETETRTPGNIVINVYGAEGQDINALADEISYRLQHLYDVRNAVFA